MECLAYAAHELRTPLTTQRALLELALADPQTDLVTWREIGEDVLRACRQLERVLEACLTLARSEEAQCFESVDLALVADETLRAHDRRSLTTVAALEPAKVNGDPGLVDRLAANLVSNAIRHNVAGGRIEVSTRTESARAVLSVANTGPVIPGGELRRLFKPFERLSSSTDGVGLGLAIVQAIADAHHATITARARIGGGLGIDVAFPALS